MKRTLLLSIMLILVFSIVVNANDLSINANDFSDDYLNINGQKLKEEPISSDYTPFTGYKSGSDSFGYEYLSTQDGDPITFNWIEISGTGTPMNLGDDDTISVMLSFAFPFYDDLYDTISINSNGTITFHSGYFGYGNTALPTNLYGGPWDVIFMMWDDLNPAAFGEVYFQDFGTYAVIEFDSVPRYSSSVGNTFEVILYDNGDILLQYKQILFYNDATIGIQDSTSFADANNWYIEYLHNSVPAGHIPGDSNAILFEYPRPLTSHDLKLHSIVTPSNTVISPSVSINPEIMIENVGVNDETAFWTYCYIEDGTGTPVFNDSLLVNDTILIDSIHNVQFSSFMPGPMEQYSMITWVYLPLDSNRGNDTLSFDFRTYDLDVGCLSINDPGTVLNPSITETVEADFRNYGTDDAAFNACFIIKDAVNTTVYSHIINIGLLSAGTDTAVSFNDWIAPIAPGGYTYYAYTIMPNDINNGNDTLMLNAASIAVWEDLSAVTSRDPIQWPGYCVDNNSRFWIAGGLDTLNNASNIVQGFDTLSGWSTTSSIPTGTFTPAVAVIDSKLYVIGGMDAGFNNIPLTQIYDIALDTWSTGTAPPDPRGGISGGVYNNCMYIIGGSATSSFPTDCPTWRYEPAADTASGTPWVQMSDCPRGAAGLILGAQFYGSPSPGNDYIYAGGDYRGYTDFYRYDPSADTASGTPWLTLPTLPTDIGTKDPCMVWDNDYAYLYGGDVGGSWSGPYSNKTYYYDNALNSWNDLGFVMNQGNEGMAGGIVGEYIVLFGGTTGSGPLNPGPFERTGIVGSGGDYTAPFVEYTSPVHSEVFVGLSETIIIGFSEPIDTSLGFTFTCTPDPGSWIQSWNAAFDTVSLSHADFVNFQTYYIEITDAYDNAGWALCTRSIPNPFGFSTGPTGLNDENFEPSFFFISPNNSIISSSVILNYAIPSSGDMSIDIYNITGAKITTLTNEYHSKGSYSIKWDINKNNIPSGIYIYKLNFNNKEIAGKLTIIK